MTIYNRQLKIEDRLGLLFFKKWGFLIFFGNFGNFFGGVMAVFGGENWGGGVFGAEMGVFWVKS